MNRGDDVHDGESPEECNGWTKLSDDENDDNALFLMPSVERRERRDQWTMLDRK